MKLTSYQMEKDDLTSNLLLIRVISNITTEFTDLQSKPTITLNESALAVYFNSIP